MQKRKYRLNQRAAQQEKTRERIVDAAIELHEEIGPAETTISALAERAGVQRLTVYRHFANETEILHACSSRWFSQNPPPDVSELADGDAEARTETILRALYDYYRRTQKMWRSVYPDVGKVDALDAVLKQFDAYLAAVEAQLAAAHRSRQSRPLRSTIRHVVRFSTWQSLNDQGLGARAMAALAGKWILAVAS